jgi:hypothetical protein
VLVSAFERQLKLLGTEYLMDDTEFWETEQHVDTMEVHEHEFLLLAVRISRILQGILCLSMSALSPLLSSPDTGLNLGEEPFSIGQ